MVQDLANVCQIVWVGRLGGCLASYSSRLLQELYLAIRILFGRRLALGSIIAASMILAFDNPRVKIHPYYYLYSSMMLQLPTYQYFSTYILVPNLRTYVSADDSRTVNGRTGSVFLFFIPHPVRQYVVVVARYVHTYVRTQRDFHPTIIKAKDSNQNHRMRQPDRTNATRFQIKAQLWQ